MTHALAKHIKPLSNSELIKSHLTEVAKDVCRENKLI